MFCNFNLNKSKRVHFLTSKNDVTKQRLFLVTSENSLEKVAFCHFLSLLLLSFFTRHKRNKKNVDFYFERSNYNGEKEYFDLFYIENKKGSSLILKASFFCES